MIASLLLAVTIVAHEPGYSTSLARHLQRWLGSEQVTARVVTPATMASALASERLAMLVGFDNPSAAEMKTLRAFRARGGKLVVFHSASSALGELMGVEPVGYRAASYPGEWSRMNFHSPRLTGAPSSIRQASTVLQRARPLAGQGRVLATWVDRQGKSTGEPAWIASAAGYWMTHVLLADGDEDLKAQLLGALVAAVEPGKWSYAVHQQRVARQAQAWTAYAQTQTAVGGEIHAVWDHTGCGLYPGSWPKTIAVLKAARVTDLWVNVAGAGFAHYPSAVLPRSRTFSQEGDQLAAVLQAAHGSGIRVHAWVICFSATRATAAQLEVFRQRGWRLKRPDGGLSEYLDPANPAVRKYLLSAIAELQARYPLAGIHLDFVRWGDGLPQPKNAAAFVTQFVSEARRQVKRPRWLTTAVYGKYPQCVTSVGQDWCRWLDLNLVDYVVPMDYCDSAAGFEELVRSQATLSTRARRTIAGIGVTANESRLDARGVIDQIRIARRHVLAGVSLFDLDTQLEKAILPYLRLGIW